MASSPVSDKKFFAIVASAVLIAGLASVAGSSMLNVTTTDVKLAEAADNQPVLTGVHREYTLVAEDVELEIAPGEKVRTWTFNGTVPGPTLRFTEGDNVTIHFINKTPLAHTVHFHGNHDDKSDGVIPQILPNQNYTYRFIADPAGALMYHCHAYPTSLHIRMGMYGALIIDPPSSESLKPAREFSLVLSEFDPDDQDSFVARYYPVNGVADQYMGENALKVRQNELVRFYVINMGTTIPYAFHLHSTIFKAYPSGLPSNAPIDAQTIEIGPGNAAIIEAKWKWEGNYLFHTHGFQEEHGGMGEIHVAAENDTAIEKLGEQSVSMIDWQYALQKSLQKPEVVQYSDEELGVSTPAGHGGHGAQDGPVVRIVQGSWDNKQKENYSPAEIEVAKGSEIVWINDDSIVHTVTDTSDATAFDSSIIGQGKEWRHKFDEAGSYEYYCTLHPWMVGEVTVTG